MEGKRSHLFKVKWLVVDSCSWFRCSHHVPAPMKVTEREKEHGWREPNKAPQSQKKQEKYSSGIQFWEFLSLNAAFLNRLYTLQRCWHVNFLILFLIYSVSWALCWSLHKAEDKWKHGSIHQEVTSVWLTSLMSATGRQTAVCQENDPQLSLPSATLISWIRVLFGGNFVSPPTKFSISVQNIEDETIIWKWIRIITWPG